jgi:hypothetical protein
MPQTTRRTTLLSVGNFDAAATLCMASKSRGGYTVLIQKLSLGFLRLVQPELMPLGSNPTVIKNNFRLGSRDRVLSEVFRNATRNHYNAG